MADPTTSNILLAIPTRGSDVGTWDLAVNGNSNALDGKFGGNTIIALSSATTILLTTPATGSVSAAPGPNQSQNALLYFSGALTGNVVVKFTLPGYYIVHNFCTNINNFFVQLQPAAGTAANFSIGAPPGRKCHVFYDGNNMDYVNMPDVGTFVDFPFTNYPAWMNACTLPPYLICDGTVFNNSANLVTLGAILGSTFGGNGVSTFGVPDLRARYRIPLDSSPAQGAANRITAAVSGINGTQWGASGGSQALQAHTHTIADPTGHNHNINQGTFASGGGVVFNPALSGPGNAQTSTTFINNLTIATTGAGNSGAIPPGLVFGQTFIKT
jgi:microcystin-dependent protein